MKATILKNLIQEATTRSEDGKILSIDYGAVAASVNDTWNELLESKQPDLDGIKKEGIASFLKDNGFDSQKSFKESIAAGTDYKTKYESLQGEVKTTALNTKITDTLTSMKVDPKYAGTVTKLLKQDGLYGEDGALNEEAFQTNIASIVKEDLMLSIEPVKVGTETDKTQTTDEPERRRKF